ncbi:MAG: ATP-binding protein [Bdellovibrionota bacterium]
MNAPDNQLFSTLVHSFPEIVWISDAVGRGVYYNQKWYSYTGLPEGTTDRDASSGVVHVEDRALAVSAWYEAVRIGESYEVQVRLRGADGQHRWYLSRSTPFKGEDGTILKWLGTATLIHEQKMSEERIRRLQDVSVSLSRAIVPSEVVRVVIETGASCLGAQAGTLVLMNDEKNRLDVVGSSGFSEEMMSLYLQGIPLDPPTPLSIATSSGQPVLLPCMEVALKQFRIVAEGAMKSGFQSLAALPLIFQGRSQGAIGICFHEPQSFDEQSVAYMKVLADQCAQALERANLYEAEKVGREKLEEAVRARDDLMSICGHELKTPLSSLALQTQLALRRLSKGDEAVCSPPSFQKLMQSFHGQIKRLNRLVEDMLDFSRINGGKLLLQPEPLNLHGLVTDVVERFEDQLSAAACPITVECETSIVGHWDRFRIEQVLINLLTNAIRYGKGSPIAITVARIPAGVQITVRDEGIGIAKENQNRIFDRFERAISASEVSGLGLGLYIVREVLVAHGGSIRVESEPGLGATFVVELPLDEG